MKGIEYKVVPAPRKAKPRKGARGKPEALARAMEELIKKEAGAGWEYLRADLIPCEERRSFFSRPIEMHRAMLVFRKLPPVVEVPRDASWDGARARPVREQPRFDPAPEPAGEEPFELRSAVRAEERAEERPAAPLPFRPLGSAND